MGWGAANEQDQTDEVAAARPKKVSEAAFTRGAIAAPGTAPPGSPFIEFRLEQPLVKVGGLAPATRADPGAPDPGLQTQVREPPERALDVVDPRVKVE